MATFAMDMQPDGWWILLLGVALVAVFFLVLGFQLGRVFEQHREKPAPHRHTGPIWEQPRQEPAGEPDRWRQRQGRRDGYINEEDVR